MFVKQKTLIVRTEKMQSKEMFIPILLLHSRGIVDIKELKY